jgi:two-component system, NarL family, sensor histidine kinase UhpB
MWHSGFLELLAPGALFRCVIDQSPIMLWVFDDEGVCIFVSRAWLSFSGRTMEEELGNGWAASVHEDDREASVRARREAARVHRPFAVEHRLRRADGEYRWMSSQGFPWFAPEGTCLGYVATCIDVTDAKTPGFDVHEAPRHLRTLIENASDMVYRTRVFPTPAVEYCGGAVAAITGHTPAEFYEDVDLTRRSVHPEDRALVAQTLDDPAHLPPIMTLRWIHADGRVVWAEHRLVPAYDESGRLVAIEGIARDVSGYVESQRRLRESEEQLRQLAARLRDAGETERAQVARELHDELGQTLTTLKLDISRTVQAVTAAGMSAGIIDRLQSVIGLSDIAVEMVKRIATKLRPPTLDHLGLAEAIRWEALTFKARTGLRCHVRSNKTRTVLKPEQQTALFRIFQEALTNIVRHAHASAVQVTLTERDDQFELRIRDNGRGVTEAQRTDPRAIGLLGMRERAALVGGAFLISGGQGKGTVVSIQVPVARAVRRAGNTRGRKAGRRTR